MHAASPPAAPSPASTRLLALDALRAVAALLVVVYHVTLAVHDNTPAALQAANGLEAPWWPFRLGSYGVQLFFMISGFVICATLGRVATVGQFARARFFRLYPIFWVAMLATSAFRLWAGDEISLTMLAANATMMPSAFGQNYVDGVYWTLEVELTFYLMMAVVWRLGALGRVPQLCLGWMLLSAGLKFAGSHGLPAAVLEPLWHWLLLPHAPYFSIGMLAYDMHRRGRLDALRLGLIALALALVFAAGPLPRSLLALAGAGCLLAVAARRTDGAPLPRGLVFLGAASYCLYLFHLPYAHHLARLWPALVQPHPGWAAALLFASVVSLGCLMHVRAERPLQALSSRWRKPACAT